MMISRVSLCRLYVSIIRVSAANSQSRQMYVTVDLTCFVEG